MKERVLFICIHNSARSQMAEALLNKYYGDRFEAQSAGLEPGKINPLAVEVMKEEGVDISGAETTDVFELEKTGTLFHYVVAVCDKEAAERCPIFAGVTKRLHWSFPDPSRVEGTWEEKVSRTREIKDMIKEQIRAWAEEGKDEL